MYGRFVALIALMLAFGLGSSATALAGVRAQAPAYAAGTVTVTTIVDGATFDVRDNGAVYRVRALGIEAPEVTTRVECWGAEANNFAHRTLAGHDVQLLSDPARQPVDQWGRALRYILLPDNRNYAVMALEGGFAWSSPPAPTSGRFDSDIAAAEQKARSGRVGLWGPPCNGQHQTVSGPKPAPAGAPGGDPRPGGTGGTGAAPTGVLLIDAGGDFGPWLKQQNAACVAAGASPGCLRIDYSKGDDPTSPRSHNCRVSVETPANGTRKNGKTYVPVGTTINVEAGCEIDPVKPDPVKPDPVKPDPVKPDPVKPDPVKPDPVKPDPVKPDPVKPDPVKPDPVKPDPGGAQPTGTKP